MRFILAKYQSFWLIVVIYGSPCHIFTHFHLLLLIISQYGSWWFTLAHCASVWILLFRVMYCDLLSLSWAHLFWLIMTHYCSFLLIADQSNLMWLIKDHFWLSWLILFHGGSFRLLVNPCISFRFVLAYCDSFWVTMAYFGSFWLILAHRASL